VDLHKLSPARLALHSAITQFDAASLAAANARRGVELQTTELHQAEEALKGHADAATSMAAVLAARAKERAASDARWHRDSWGNEKANERKLRIAREAKQAAEELVRANKLALDVLMSERDEALLEVTAAATRRADAIELVLAEEGAALLARAREAERRAAIARAELMALDGLHIASGGKMRLILANRSIPANRDIVAWLRAPLPGSIPTHEQKSLWRAFAARLEADAEVALGDDAVRTAASQMPKPAPAFQPPAIRWEESAAYRAQAAGSA
jgi:hypothetical protein